jgi:Na+-translocating ferredoxin:NAD+ oxidoreductase RnfC subunit
MSPNRVAISIDATYNPTVKAGQKVQRGQRLCDTGADRDPIFCPLTGVIEGVRFDSEDHAFVITLLPDLEP